MMEPKTYATAGTFRRALEVSLQDLAKKEAVGLRRLRRQDAFDRFLARLFREGQPRTLPWILKGGYSMEQRIKPARTTTAVSLAFRGLGSGRARGRREKRPRLEKL